MGLTEEEEEREQVSRRSPGEVEIVRRGGGGGEDKQRVWVRGGAGGTGSSLRVWGHVSSCWNAGSRWRERQEAVRCYQTELLRVALGGIDRSPGPSTCDRAVSRRRHDDRVSAMMGFSLLMAI